MKVQLKSVLKSNFNKIRWMEERQIVYPVGNNLFIQQIGKPEGDFISLDKQNYHLFDFLVSPNCKHIFTAEKTNNGIQINSYNIENEKKSVRLSQSHNYLPLQLIESIHLLVDQFQSSVVYVLTKTKNEACITLLDMFKSRVISHGFSTQFNQGSVCSEQTYEISICGRGFVRRLKAADGAWAIQQKVPKKLINTDIGKHFWLPLQRCLMASKTTIYIVSEIQVIQVFTVSNQQDPIFQIIKIPNGFISFTNQGKIKLFCQQGEESLYSERQQLALNIQNSYIKQVQFNPKSDEVLVVSGTGKFYHSKIEQASPNSNKQNYFSFQEISLNYSNPLSGTITTTAGQSLCLISTEKNVELWDLNRLCPTINLEINSLGLEKVVKATALNPDGHSVCVGFIDKVRFYRILLNKMKQFGQYPVKNTTLIQYSHGGQLVAIIFGKSTNSCLIVINTLNLKEVLNIKLGFKAAQAIWNEHDDQIYISGEDTKIIQIYQISSRSKKASLNFEMGLGFMRFDYLTKKLMVSAQSEIHLINSQHVTESVIKSNIKDFDYIFPVQGIYLIADKMGGLYCSNSIQFQKFQYLSLFTKQRFHLVYRKGILIAYSSPSNAILLRLKVGSEQNKNQVQQDIVLVQKDQINKFFDKVKILQNQLDQLQTSTSMKLDFERKTYIQDLQRHQQAFKLQTQSLRKSFNDLQAEKARQQKNNARIFDQLETGQVKNVNDLQKIYDMKIRLQKQKYLSLQQENLEQKMKYQNIIKGLQEKYHKDIQRTRKQYSEKLTNQIKSMQNEKQRHVDYKKKVETKLIDLQQQSEMTIFQLQMSKDNQIKNLMEKQTKLQRQYDAKMIALHNTEEDMKQLTNKYNETVQRIKRNEKIVQQNINKVQILQNEIEKKNKIIDEKNAIIQQQAHQIDGLQKAKYVLSFRTTEVRKQLQPKQTLIQKLKTQLFKLDEEYKNERKRNFELTQKLQKMQKISSNVKKQNNELKTQFKNKDRVHNDMCAELFLLVNNVDPKQWNKQLVKIYQNYVHEEKVKMKSQKKDDSTCQQINRHLIHVQQSLHQVATGNQKMLKGKEKQVIRKMKQNAELVYDLNIMRKKQNQYLNEIKEMNTEISRLKRQLHENVNLQKSTRANTAVTSSGTRRVISRDPANANNNSDWVDLSMKRQSTYLLPDKSNRKGRVFSAHKTMVWREQKKDKSKLSDLARELQSAKNTIMRQDRMIQELNQRLLGLPEESYN